MNQNPPEALPVVVAEVSPAATDGKSVFNSDDVLVTTKLLPVADLERNLNSLALAIQNLLANLPQVGQFTLNEVSLEAEITAEAGFALVGTSKLAGKGAVTLKFTRSSLQ